MNQLGDRRPRHQHPLVHVKLVAGKKGAVEQVRQRNALVGPPPGQRDNSFTLSGSHRPGIGTRRIAMVKPELAEDQPGSFVNRVVGAVAIVERGRFEIRGNFANQRLNIARVACIHRRILHASAGFIRIARMKPRNLIIALVAGVALAAGLWLAMTTVSQNRQLQFATELPAPSRLPEFSLLDQNGNHVDASVFEGQWDLVFFGFTHCPDICPITLQVLSDARRQLADAGHSPLPRIVLVSVDPERDTPEALGNYVAAFGEDNLGITGELQELKKLTSVLGIFFQKAASDSEYYSVDHSSVVVVIDPDGRYRAVFSSPHKPSNFVRDLPLLMR